MTGRTVDADSLLAMMPLATTLGIELDEVGRDEVVGRMAHDPSLCTVAGMLHGGMVVTLADSVAGMCAYLNLPDGAMTSTIELKCNYFAAVRDGAIVAVARPLHIGGTTIVVQTDVYHQADATRRGDRVAQVTQTQAVLRREPR
jgi:1,4-dihydroxy-2-naphthoyl-CoA hydrolase